MMAAAGADILADDPCVKMRITPAVMVVGQSRRRRSSGRACRWPRPCWTTTTSHDERITANGIRFAQHNATSNKTQVRKSYGGAAPRRQHFFLVALVDAETSWISSWRFLEAASPHVARLALIRRGRLFRPRVARFEGNRRSVLFLENHRLGSLRLLSLLNHHTSSLLTNN